MKKLTKGNYEKLPEILKKKEEAKRHEELLAKKEKAAKFQKELDARIRGQLQKTAQKKAIVKPATTTITKETKTTETTETINIT